MKAIVIGIIGMSLGMMACHDGCDPEDTRCDGTVVQVCAGDEDWERVVDCATIWEAGGRCCEDAIVLANSISAGCVIGTSCEVDGGQ